MFGCRRLETVPKYNISACQRLSSLFYGCYALTSAPAFETSQAYDVGGMFGHCSSLSVLPALDLSGVSTADSFNLFVDEGCHLSKSLEYGRRYGPEYDAARGGLEASYSGQALSASALNEIFTNLGTAEGAQYLHIRGAYGAADISCDRTIATAKGWTILG
jgi:hypothetical protein